MQIKLVSGKEGRENVLKLNDISIPFLKPGFINGVSCLSGEF
jgi:hypothetical protein